MAWPGYGSRAINVFCTAAASTVFEVKHLSSRGTDPLEIRLHPEEFNASAEPHEMIFSFKDLRSPWKIMYVYRVNPSGS